MNNDNSTTTYYVTVDSNNYVLTASTAPSDNTRKVDMPNASLTDFFAHMNLYQVYENGKIDYPEIKAATLANQISTLKATADEQSSTVATLITQNQNLQKLLVGLQASFTAQLAKLQSAK